MLDVMRKPFMKSMLLIVAILLIQGCTSNLYLGESGLFKSDVNESKLLVYVTNANHKNYDVLKRAGIYELSSDEFVSTSLTLLDEDLYLRCGNPMLGAIVTLGILPGYIDASEGFRYSLEEKGLKTEYIHNLHIYQRISIWEWFAKPFIGSSVKVRSKALNKAPRELYTGS